MVSRLLFLPLAMFAVLTAPCTIWANFEVGQEAYKRGDYTMAFKEWRPLAEAGNAEAQAMLGTMYEFGQGVPKSDQEALRWYRMAAERGYLKRS
jgi:TPR repeat protein